MPESLNTIELLAIQFWIHDAAPIHRALDIAGFIARITRVDIEPALNAALGRGPWDLVVMDPSIPDITIATVRRAMESFRCKAPLIVIDDPVALSDRVYQALHARRC